jgi:hypothetical protein
MTEMAACPAFPYRLSGIMSKGAIAMADPKLRVRWLLVIGLIALAIGSLIAAASSQVESRGPKEQSQFANQDSPQKRFALSQTQPVAASDDGGTMTGTPIPMPLDPAMQKIVAKAKQDLAQRLPIPEEQIKMVDVQSVVWPDKSLGCPQPGMVYTQVQVDGLLIRFKADGKVYEYHGGGDRSPFLCKNPGDSSEAK